MWFLATLCLELHEIACTTRNKLNCHGAECAFMLLSVIVSNCNTNVLEILRFRMNQGRKSINQSKLYIKLISCCDSLYIALRTQAVHSLKRERERTRGKWKPHTTPAFYKPGNNFKCLPKIAKHTT